MNVEHSSSGYNSAATEDGEPYVDASFESFHAEFLADPGNRAVYEQVALEKEIWLQLQEARLEAGLTQQEVAERMGVSQAQVARLEKHGYTGYAIRSLQRYAQALNAEYEVKVSIRKRTPQPTKRRKALDPA